MRTKISLETIVCLAFIGLGIFAYLTIGQSESSASPFLLNQERALGALDYSSLPKIYAVTLVVCCVANLLLQSIKRRREQQTPEYQVLKEKAEAKAPPDLQQQDLIRFRTLATISLTVLYSLLLPHTPFLYPTIAFLFAMFWVYGQRNLMRTLLVSILGGFSLWGLFIKLASLPLGII